MSQTKHSPLRPLVLAGHACALEPVVRGADPPPELDRVLGVGQAVVLGDFFTLTNFPDVGEQKIICLFKNMIRIGVSLDCDAYDRVAHVCPDEGWLAGVVEEGEGVVHGAAQRLHFAALNRALQKITFLKIYISCLNKRQTHVLYGT